MDNINIGLRSYTIILLITTVSFIAGSNINCNGKAFHCVNSTHFKICVDLGHGVSMTVDEFLIPCPQKTVCKQYNLFECEYEVTTTLPPVKIQSEVTNENFNSIDSSVRKHLDITTLFPTKQQDGMELPEKYFNKINATPASFTESFLTDAVIDSWNTSNANDLHTSSKGDINKTLNISLSTDKVLTSITESGIDVPRSLYNINTLVTDTGVSSKYNTETPVFFSTTQDSRTIDSLKMESVKPFNQNSSDLDASYTVTKRTNQVSSVSEWRYSAVTLLPSSFSDPSLQENTPRTSNINHLIKSDNTSQDNLDILFKYNTTQLNNSDNNTQYRNIKNSMYSKNTITDTKSLNSTPFNIIKDEIFTSGVSDINRKSKVNSDIILKPSGQNLAEITTASTIIVPGTTNQFSSHIFLNTEVIETFFNDGLNITTNLENVSISDGDILSSIILDKKNATASNKPTTSHTKNSKLRSDSEILNLKDEFEVNFTTELSSVNNSQYLTTTDQYFHQRSDMPITSTSKSEVTAPININNVLPLRSKIANQVHNAIQINYVNTMESELVSTNTPEIQPNLSFLSRPNFSLFTIAATKTATNDKIIVGDYNFTSVDMLPVLTTAEMSNGDTSSKPLPYLITKNKPLPESVIVIGGTYLDNNNITNTEESNNKTGEISKRVTSLKPISDLISKNDSRPKPVMVTIATDLDNNNIATTEENNNMTAKLSNGVTSLKSISDLMSKNETRLKPIMVTVATDLGNKNVTTTEGSSNITAETSNAGSSLKPTSDLKSNNETRGKPVMLTIATDLGNKNITPTEGSSNITAETSNRVSSVKPTSDLISKNETRPKPVMVTVAKDLGNNNVTTKEGSSNITAETSNGVLSLKPTSDLKLNNETRAKPVMLTIAMDLGNKNIIPTEGSSNITAETSNRVSSVKPTSDLISKNETRPKPVLMTLAKDLDTKNVTTTKGSTNITAETSNGVLSLKPTSDLISKNETRPKPVMMTIATDLGNKNVTTTEGSTNITAETSNGLLSLKPTSDLISKNESRPKPVLVTLAKDLDTKNVTTTEGSSNITAELSKGVTSLKSISDLNLKNETRLKPIMVTVATDFGSKIVTTTEGSSNITAETSNAGSSLKPTSDLKLNNETRAKPVMLTIAMDLGNKNIIPTEGSSNITAETSNRVSSVKPTSDLISKNETRPKPVLVTLAKDLDTKNVTTTKGSTNITAETSNGVLSLKPTSDLISKNETRPKPVMMTIATDLGNKNVTTTEGSTNITAELSKGVTSLKSISDLISKNETRTKPVMVTVATGLSNKNITTAEGSTNITAETSNGVLSLKSISDLISKNETRLKPIMVTVATDLGNKNVTTTEGSSNITAETSNAGSSLKPTSDLKSNNETRGKPVMLTIATDLGNKNITPTEGSSNITAETSNRVSSVKPTSDLISMNETRTKSVLVTVAKDLDTKNVTTTEGSSNITAELSKGVTSLKSISDLISKNETRPKPVMVTVATGLSNKNITTTEGSSNIIAEISKGVTRLTSISDLVSKNESSPKSVMATVATNTIDSFHKVNITDTNITDHQSLDESTTSLSSIIKIPNNILKTKHFNKDSVGLISSTDSAISDLPTTLDKPTTLTDKSSGVLDNNNTTHNNDTTKPINNSLYAINKALSYNYTHKDNRTSDVYQSTTENDRAFITVESLRGPVVLESSNSMNVTNNTFIVIDMLSEHRAVSDNNKNIENTSKLESKITTKLSSYFDRNKSSIHVISSDTKNVTTLSSQSAKNEINTKRVIHKNTSDNSKILGKSSFVNPNLTKPTPENNLIPKLVTNNNFSLSPDFHITYMNHNITDKNNNSLTDVPNKSVGVINTYFNYPGKNLVPSVSNNSKSVPLIYLNNSLTKLPLTNIYNVSHSYFSKNISQNVNKTTESKKSHDIEDKDSSQTNISGHVPGHAFSIVEHERNRTKYLLINPYTQVNTPAIKVNDTTLKEITYNFSEPSFTVKNNVQHDFIMKNITTSTNKNTAPKGFYDTKGSGYDKSRSTTTIKSVNINNCTNCSKLSEISNSQLSGNVIKPLLIVKESLQEEKNTSSLLLKNGNVFSEDILNSWGIVNTTLVANITKRTKTFTHDGNVSEVNSLSFIKTTEKHMNKLNTSSESNSTANLLRNMSSQTNIIKNMTHDGMSSNGLQFSRIPSQFDKSSQSGPIKMVTIPFVLNRTKFEKNTISEYTNQSNRIEKKLLTSGHGQSEYNLTIANSVTQNISNNTQNSFITPINSINYPNKHFRNLTTNQEFRCTKRGKFSDTKDCTKFFVCIGRVQPVIGLCPTDSVFSEYLKQCTKNVTHCIRNNQFKCTVAGRFINILSNNTYFICAKQRSSFIKFTLQCQKSYYLDKNSVKCTPKLKNISKSDESSSKNTKELSFDKSKKMEGVSINSKNVFECEKEGKFKDPQDCRKYYVCKKGRNSIYRRKIKQCDSDEVFHKKKMECVDVESYECDI